jgi:hypothetical protein
VITDGAEGLQEPLPVLRRFEALERPLSLPHRPVRVLRPIVEAFVPPVLGLRQEPLERRWVAGEFVGDLWDARRPSGLRRALVHVVQAAEDGARDDRAGWPARGWPRPGTQERRRQRQTAVGPLGVVERHVLLEHGLQVPLVEDQHVVEALLSERADDPLRDRVGPR